MSNPDTYDRINMAAKCCGEYGVLHPGLVQSVANAIGTAVDEAVAAERACFEARLNYVTREAALKAMCAAVEERTKQIADFAESYFGDTGTGGELAKAIREMK